MREAYTSPAQDTRLGTILRATACACAVPQTVPTTAQQHNSRHTGTAPSQLQGLAFAAHIHRRNNPISPQTTHQQHKAIALQEASIERLLVVLLLRLWRTTKATGLLLLLVPAATILRRPTITTTVPSWPSLLLHHHATPTTPTVPAATAPTLLRVAPATTATTTLLQPLVPTPPTTTATIRRHHAPASATTPVLRAAATTTPIAAASRRRCCSYCCWAPCGWCEDGLSCVQLVNQVQQVPALQHWVKRGNLGDRHLQQEAVLLHEAEINIAPPASVVCADARRSAGGCDKRGRQREHYGGAGAQSAGRATHQSTTLTSTCTPITKTTHTCSCIRVNARCPHSLHPTTPCPPVQPPNPHKCSPQRQMRARPPPLHTPNTQPPSPPLGHSQHPQMFASTSNACPPPPLQNQLQNHPHWCCVVLTLANKPNQTDSKAASIKTAVVPVWFGLFASIHTTQQMLCSQHNTTPSPPASLSPCRPPPNTP